jgi:putative transposase
VYAAAFRFERGHWVVSITGMAAELHHARRSPTGRHRVPVGVDLGVKTLAVAVDADGVLYQQWEGVKALQHAQARLRLANQSFSRTKRGSVGRIKAARRLGRIHARVAALRKILLHEVTTALARGCTTLVVEDLNVAGMVRNHALARHVSDAGFSELRRLLAYKAAWYGAELVVADRWFASSRLCSGCGAHDAALTLSDRSYRCSACGMVLDRDVNAAINLARWTPAPPLDLPDLPDLLVA